MYKKLNYWLPFNISYRILPGLWMKLSNRRSINDTFSTLKRNWKIGCTSSVSGGFVAFVLIFFSLDYIALPSFELTFLLKKRKLTKNRQSIWGLMYVLLIYSHRHYKINIKSHLYTSIPRYWWFLAFKMFRSWNFIFFSTQVGELNGGGRSFGSFIANFEEWF